MQKHASSIYSYPAGRLETTANQVGIKAPPISYALERTMTKVSTEIDLFALNLVQRAGTGKTQRQREGPQAVFNIYSPVGAIQTGSGATANIVQNLGSQDRDLLIKALELTKQALSSVDEIPGNPKEEVVELVEEAKTEVAKTKPNGVRLTSILTAIATAIQTAGSLQPAYQALKAALLPLGILLP